MQTTTIMQSHRRIHVLAALAMLLVAPWSHAAIEAKAAGGDGWHLLSQGSAAVPSASPSATATSLPAGTTGTSLAVAPVVLPGTASSATFTLTITPQDINLRNALDRWLQTQGWQLAWSVDSDLPLAFNATFTGDFTSVLTQAMRATNHMSTPTRICRHTNNVIRVIARAANCKD